MLDKLRACNPSIKIHSITDPEFRVFGQIHRVKGTDTLLKEASNLYKPEDGTHYIASEPVLEDFPVMADIKSRLMGDIDFQVGCCYGYNTHLNGMEYHKSSEIIGAVTPFVLILGRLQDVSSEGKWDSSLSQFFYVPKGTFLELYATSLHLAPCRISAEPFTALILLPRGTNTPVERKEGSAWMVNKWLISHPDSAAAKKGAPEGITGINPEINPISA